MLCITDDQDVTSVGFFLPGDTVNLFHKRTGGIHRIHALLFQKIIHLFPHAVGPDDDCTAGEAFQFFFGVQNFYALFLQFLYHDFIVYNGAISVNGALRLLHLFVYRVHGPAHAKAEPGRFRKPYFHRHLLVNQIGNCRDYLINGHI